MGGKLTPLGIEKIYSDKVMRSSFPSTAEKCVNSLSSVLRD